MNLRTIKASAVAAALLAVAAVGCTDTTVQPKSAVGAGQTFANPAAYEYLLAKVYATFALTGQQGPAGNNDVSYEDEGFSQYMRLYWEMEELPTDEAVIGWGDVGLPALNTGVWTSTNGFTGGMYYRIFYAIAMANDFLRLTDGVNTPEMPTYRAEARFLRALAYFHAIDLFGDVPLSTTISATQPTQAKRADIFAFLISELNAIKGQLPPSTAAYYGRATTQAANMLLAELYLNAGVYTGTPNWAGAQAAAQAVITSGAYSLDNTYAYNFGADNNLSPEIIFAITQDGQHTQSYGMTSFLIHAECFDTPAETAVSLGYGSGNCWYGLRMKPEAVHFYDTTADHPAGDSRINVIVSAGQNLQVTCITGCNTDGYLSRKWNNNKSTGGTGSNSSFADTDFPVWRLAEAYLIYAEAALRGGSAADSAQALTYVNLLRTRAYNGASGNITAAQLTLPFILKERGRELLWEAHRRTDLIRFGHWSDAAFTWSWENNVQAGAAYAACLNLYPIPSNEIVANPNMKQVSSCY